MTGDETILCIEKKALPGAWLGDMTAVPIREAECYGQIPARAIRFLPRETVETDSRYKQIIPYLLIHDTGSHRFGCYQRKGTEARLHDLWSVGVGGHVTIADSASGPGDLKSVVTRGLVRELSEELQMAPQNGTRFLGIINEEQTAVGRVHLGLVHGIRVSSPESITPGPELFRFCWKTIPELAELKLEHWSNLALRLVDGIG